MLAAADWVIERVHTLHDMQRCMSRILAAMQDAGYARKEIFGARLALEEAIVNAIKHGHRNDTSKCVEVRFQVNEHQMLIEVRDQGPGFDPDGLPDPLAPQNLERPGGRGVFLIRQYMTWVQFNETGNAVTLCKVKGQ
jgi:serine/threonine-protein kinase RsbW